MEFSKLFLVSYIVVLTKCFYGVCTYGSLDDLVHLHTTGTVRTSRLVDVAAARRLHRSVKVDYDGH